ncbi:hypothetical protein C8Q70DRAFT_998023 [Cubamyces menziesii]|nr:hypothetical protein C8Q70DRAFT_998023 [Cubamyces menziesii]
MLWKQCDVMSSSPSFACETTDSSFCKLELCRSVLRKIQAEGSIARKLSNMFHMTTPRARFLCEVCFTRGCSSSWLSPPACLLQPTTTASFPSCSSFTSSSPLSLTLTLVPSPVCSTRGTIIRYFRLYRSLPLPPLSLCLSPPFSQLIRSDFPMQSLLSLSRSPLSTPPALSGPQSFLKPPQLSLALLERIPILALHIPSTADIESATRPNSTPHTATSVGLTTSTGNSRNLSGLVPLSTTQASASVNAATTLNQSTPLDTSVSNTQTTLQTFEVSSSPTLHSSSTTSGIGSSRSLFQNAYAIAGVFTVIGLAMVIITIAIVVNAFRRRDRKRRGRESAAAIRPPSFVDDDYHLDGRLENGGGGANLRSLYSNATHGTFSRPPMTTGENYYVSRRAPCGYEAAAAAVDIGVLGLNCEISPYSAPCPIVPHTDEDRYHREPYYRAPRGVAPRIAIYRRLALDEHPGRRRL